MATIIPSSQDDAFDPDALRAMSIALEEVCRTLQVDGDQRAREVMAVRIVELARRGERDPSGLATECCGKPARHAFDGRTIRASPLTAVVRGKAKQQISFSP